MERCDDSENHSGDTSYQVSSGSLLLANTTLVEPTFRRTVVYIIEHNHDGALGVVLNRPSDTVVYNLLPQWSDLACKPKIIFIGGPVRQNTVLCLGLLRPGADVRGIDGLRHVFGRLIMIDLDIDPQLIAHHLEGIRIFAGYAGWIPGQLNNEINRHDWIVAPALPSDILVPPGIDLWGQVLRRQSWPMSLLATHPIDIHRN